MNRSEARTDPLNVLVTGGAGFIGSHACVALADAGFRPVIFDNFSNSDPKVVERIARISGVRPRVIAGDVRDAALLAHVFKSDRFDAVMHFAGLKAVGESVLDPLPYYEVNVGGTLAVLKAAHPAGIQAFVFSSSATVYGEPDASPVSESAPLRPASPYANSKCMAETVLADFHAAHPAMGIAVLRYFNPVGAHESGLIGEHPRGFPNNLMPYVCQVAVGTRERLTVHGADYPTPDGTGVRDYIHVMDLAQGHVSALRRSLAHGAGPGAERAAIATFNLGTGQGASVLEVIQAFSSATGRPVPYTLGPRRPGDVPAYWANADKAREVLGWQATRSLHAMCSDSWRWQSGNPAGY